MSNENTVKTVLQEEKNVYDKQYDIFKQEILSNANNYSNRNTFYFKMRFASPAIHTLYNKVSNELLAYVNNYDTAAVVERKITPECCEFTIYDSVLLRFVITGENSVDLYLASDPERYGKKNNAPYECIPKETPDGEKGLLMLFHWKENGDVKDDTIVKYIREMAGIDGLSKTVEYVFCEYSTFFLKEDYFLHREIKYVNGIAQNAIEEPEPEKKPKDKKESKKEDKKSKDSKNGKDSKDVTPEGQPVEEKPKTAIIKVTNKNYKSVKDDDVLVLEITSVPEPKEEKKDNIQMVYAGATDDLKVKQTDKKPAPQKKKQPEKPKKEEPTYKAIDVDKKQNAIAKQKNLWNELAVYGTTFTGFQKLLVYVLTVSISVGFAVAFQLKWWTAAIVIILDILLMPFAVSAFFKRKFEILRFREASSYIEQMLYSFQKYGKIIKALDDTLIIFPAGRMHNAIMRARNYIQNSSEVGGNPYKKALGYIEEAYPSRRLKTVHRYLIKVENSGGNHSVGIDALLKDRRLWIDRVDKFRAECKKTTTSVIISVLFSAAVAAFIVWTLPTEHFSLSDNIAYQIMSAIYAAISLVVVVVVYARTVVPLNDIEVRNEKKTVEKMKWLKNYDPEVEKKKRLTPCVVFSGVIVIGIILGITQKQWLILPVGVIGLVYALFFMIPMQLKSAKKSVARAVEEVFPDWLLEIALLLQNDNVHVAIEKTVDESPAILHDELQDLTEAISKYPTEYYPYADFFNLLDVESVHSSMRLLYSMQRFGTENEVRQIAELVERNNQLMDIAERYKNDDRVTSVYALQFVPSLTSAIHMMMTMMIFLFSYMSIMTSLS